MSAKKRTEKVGEEAKVEEPQGFAEMCRCMPSGEMPDCCGPEMKEMMGRFMAAFQPKENK
jgi:hypothetical protein